MKNPSISKKHVYTYPKRSEENSTLQTLVSQLCSQALKKIAKIIVKEDMQHDFLYLFFGEKVADGYRYGDSSYYESYYEKIPTVFTAWLCQQFPNTDEIYVEERYKELIEALLVWGIKSSRKRMLVSLDEASSFKMLKQQQSLRLIQHQLKMLHAIIKGYNAAASKKAVDLNAYTPSAAKHVSLSYKGVSFCSYETFLHLSTSAIQKEIPFAAKNILTQLDTDYVHHGLTLSAKELSLFLKLHHSNLSAELMLTETSEADFYETVLGKNILHAYVSGEQLQDIVRQHTMLLSEKKEREAWHYELQKSQFPPRLLNRIKKMLLPFHEMYVVTLNHRKEFYYELKPLYKQMGYEFDGYFSCFSRLLLDAECHMKYVLQAYERFSYNQNYLRTYPLKHYRLHYTLDLKFLHDFYLVLHPAITRVFYALKQHKVKKETKKVSNILLKSMLSYNLDSSSNITDLVQLLNAVYRALVKNILMQKEVLTKINKQSSLSSVLTICEDRELQIDNLLLYNIKNILHVEEKHLQMAANMLVKGSYIELCAALIDHIKYPLYHAPSQVKDLVENRFNFTVSVLPHNHPIALLGPSLSSVCIDFGSVYHHQQLNPSFMNLCIYTEHQLFLWGLLCRAYDHKNDKLVYILNNFQGSINDHHIRPRQVQHAVLDTLRAFMKINNIDTILLKDQFFNTINLCEGLPTIRTVPNRLLLERNARLDFDINSQGAVQQDEFYALEILKEKS